MINRVRFWGVWGALWCSGSCSRLEIRGWVRIPVADLCIILYQNAEYKGARDVRARALPFAPPPPPERKSGVRP